MDNGLKYIFSLLSMISSEIVNVSSKHYYYAAENR